jgi:phage tail sheath protein FI
MTSWRRGMLAGGVPAEGFSVRCDGTTMTSEDLANGRTVCRVQAALKDPPTSILIILTFSDLGPKSLLRIGS